VTSRSLFLLLFIGVLGVTTLPRFTTAHFQSKQSNSDASLAAVRREDRLARNAKGTITRLSPEEHLRRAGIYHANRAFDEAREHWQGLMNYYSNDPRVAEALQGIGRSYFQARRYYEAYNAYDRLARSYPSTKEGRKGLNSTAASFLRLGKTWKAADR